MTSLWIGLVVLGLIAAGFIVWPFLRYRAQPQLAPATDVKARLEENVRLFQDHLHELEQQLAAGRISLDQFEQLKLEQERALLADEASIRAAQETRQIKVSGLTFLVVALLLALVAFCLYHKLGSSADVEIRVAQAEKAELDQLDQHFGRSPDPERARKMISLIKARLEDKPDQLQYWFFLARLYMDLNDFAGAADAYQEVLKRDSESPLVMAEAAQAMFLRDGSKVSPPIAELVHKALKKEPDNTMALGLAGIEAFGNKDYLSAIKYWGRTLKLTGTSTPGAQALSAGIERATGLFFANGGTQEELDAARAGRQITVVVKLDEGVVATPDQAVFVYARAWQGAKLPLAIARLRVADLPARVVLTESMAMSETMTLASVEQVELVARISQDGTATAKVGDWQGSIGPVDSAKAPDGLEIVIHDKIAP